MDDKVEDLIPVVAELAGKYTGGDSTSVSYERAQQFMEAVLYCLHEFRNSSPNGLAAERLTAAEQYRAGLRLVREKASEIRAIYNELAPYFDDYGMECLHDTVKKGIPEFLKHYDAVFCPQNTLLTLDYPVLADLHLLSGADAVYRYLQAIRTEQIFLGGFRRDYVTGVLQRALPGYRYLLENICSNVLINAAGHALLGKPFREEGFSRKDLTELQAVLSGAAGHTEALLLTVTDQLAERYEACAPEIRQYLGGDAHNVTVRIQLAAETGQLDKLFVL